MILSDVNIESKNCIFTEGNCNGSELFKKSYKNTLLEIKKICDGFESLYEAGKDSETYWINNDKKVSWNLMDIYYIKDT